jgi:ketosteroid isomerase-like protein
MTRFSVWHSAVTSLVLAGMVVMPVQAQDSGDDGTTAEVRAVIEAVAAGMQAGDFASLDTLFSSDPGLHIIEGAGVNHGWADYRDHHLKPEVEAFENFSYRWYAIEPTVNGDVAFSPFRYDLAADTERGHVEVEGRGTIVLQRDGGRWQVAHLHTSGRPKR